MTSKYAGWIHNIGLGIQCACDNTAKEVIKEDEMNSELKFRGMSTDTECITIV